RPPLDGLSGEGYLGCVFQTHCLPRSSVPTAAGFSLSGGVTRLSRIVETCRRRLFGTARLVAFYEFAFSVSGGRFGPPPGVALGADAFNDRNDLVFEVTAHLAVDHRRAQARHRLGPGDNVGASWVPDKIVMKCRLGDAEKLARLLRSEYCCHDLL